VTRVSDDEIVTVIIPVYNRAHLIDEAVDSVKAQTWKHLDVVVVDDGSSDDSAAIVERRARDDRSIRVIRQANGGPSSARNAGLRATTSRLVTFLDSDDVMVPERIEAQLSKLRRHPEADGVIGIEQIEVADGVTPPRWVRALPPADQVPRYYNMSVLLDRSWLDRIGGFDESVHVGEDIDLMVRLRRAGARIDTLDQVVVRRRIHGDNLIYREDEVDSSMLQAIHRHLTAVRPDGPSKGAG
jgi:glycosyltransferase involved in cell wall biosynthesis